MWCVSMSKTVTALKTQSATKIASSSAWTQTLVSFVLWLERNIQLSSRTIKMIKYCIWVENFFCRVKLLEETLLHHAAASIYRKIMNYVYGNDFSNISLRAWHKLELIT